MSKKPIFVATHPRACSTAFERVFMTQRDTLKCVHEPFGDAFYFGPERLSSRYEKDEKEREESGFSQSTYKTVLERIDRESSEGKRLFIKDICHYLLPPHGNPASIAPSLLQPKKGVGTDGHANGSFLSSPPYPYGTAPEPDNPTVIPLAILKDFHFTFLIRHPRSSIPSYYRCTIPPLDSITGFYDFMPSEAGYDELRRTFDYLLKTGVIVKHSETNGETKGINHAKEGSVQVCVVDADDLLDNPSGIIEAYCKSVGVEYKPSMLNWDTELDHKQAKEAFEKWKGFHEDAINSTELRPRTHKKKERSREEEDAEWRQKYGEKGAKIIRETVDANVEDYLYLKQFALKV
ncbi:MAG: hypothetical protein M1824_001186 [Vezdaea acicularis]|nr:MAG: hypothetical protein M1824_001186 [Vezdaea acicularis]